MSRVTYKMLKQWVAESEFCKTHGWTLGAWSGYYHILDASHNIMCCGKTPLECWNEFNLYKAGYYLAMREMGKEV